MTTPAKRAKVDSSSPSPPASINRYIPDEIWIEILSHVDNRTLPRCRFVCKDWNSMIRGFVWRKKAERAIGKALPAAEWTTYYLICAGLPMYKNLLKNHSGESGLRERGNWTILKNGGTGWDVESINKANGPKDSSWSGEKHCFVTSFNECVMEQTVNLRDAGLSDYVLDVLRPTIKVTEWFRSGADRPAEYELRIKLYGQKLTDIMETIDYAKVIEYEQINQWFKFTHEINDYGKGLRNIKFWHRGYDRSQTPGNYGTKMAGACISLEMRDDVK
ncbi:F-box only protein 6-like [Trichogramma pretiosum]|uniref:F-box only protein 6-like n=1 Tax=Trichogramma pretiosum TaxID=7493 RepID=UPI0006C9C815|nr:F-box only protein 6-like [Trichogramma pretiosum]